MPVSRSIRLRRLQRARHHRAVSDDRQVVAGPHDLGLAERNHVVRSGIGRAAKGLAIKPLVLQEQHRIVAANRRAQQAVGVERIRRQHHPHARRVGEDAFAALRVIDGAAGEIAADRRPAPPRAGEGVVGAPAHQRQLIAKLVHGRPDVVEELNLDDRLQPARGHADGAAYNIGLRQRRVEDAVAAKLASAVQPSA